MISGNFVEIEPRDAEQFADAWKDPRIAARQYQVAKQDIALYRPPVTGNIAFDNVVYTLRGLNLPRPIRLLDVGAACGYYREIIRQGGVRIEYRGIDCSEACIELGRQLYLGIRLDLGDTSNLDFADDSFDVVLSSAVIMHVSDWKRALAEAVRVAKSYVILARTPVSIGATSFYKKIAYDVECLEIHFGETDLIEAFRQLKVHIASSTILTTDPAMQYRTVTYLLAK